MTSRQSFKSLQAKLQPLRVQSVTDELRMQQQDGPPWETLGLQGQRAVLIGGGGEEIISVLQQGAAPSELTSNHSMHCVRLKRRLLLRRLFLLSVSLLEIYWGPSFAADAGLDCICNR